MYISGNLGFERLRDPPNVTELLSSVWIEYGNFIFNVFPKLQENNPQSAVLKRKHSDLALNSQLLMTITSKIKK